MTFRHALRFCVIAAVVMVIAAACGEPAPKALDESSTAQSADHDFTGRVSTTETGLVLDGRTWFPAGFNSYQLGTDWAINVGCGAQVDLDEYFGKLPPRALTRFNLYSAFVVDKKTGKNNLSRLDAVFAAAKRHNQMILPVLTGSSGACENEKFKERSWYQSGWHTTEIAAGMTFSDWLSTAIKRWRDEPTLAGWEPVGESEASNCGATGCAWQTRTCPANGAAVPRTFFDEVGQRIRAIDPTHPIFSGFVGGDQCGLTGGDYARVAASPGLDVLDYHDYSAGGAIAPGGSNLPARLAQARNLGKPLVVNEIGIEAGSCLSLDARARQFTSKYESLRSVGVAGALLWAFVPDPRTDECTFDIGYDDPAWQVVAHEIS
ncbi:beta-mannosidase [Gordonia sputi]